MKVLITGGAGFVGSHIVDRLVASKSDVYVIDNLSTGRPENLSHHFGKKNFTFFKRDILSDDLSECFRGVEDVWHLAANADVRKGVVNTSLDFEHNIRATYKILEYARTAGVKKFIFASSSTVYGEATLMPTPENYAPLFPISMYGAAKLACESMVSAYSHMFGINSWIYRFANVVGERNNHGIIFDFIDKLTKDRNSLEILGNGKQKKSYIQVSDCIDAMFAGLESKEKVSIFNIGTPDSITVNEIAEVVSKSMNASPKLYYTGGKRGWVGDVPVMLLEISRLSRLGWKPKHNSKAAVECATKEILNSINVRI